MSKRRIHLVFVFILFLVIGTKAQQGSISNICGLTDDYLEKFWKTHPGEESKYHEYESFIQEFVKKMDNDPEFKAEQSRATFTIPVVFHVYGGATHTFWGKTVTETKVVNALVNLNKDFQGLNPDYSTVNVNFANIKAPLDIQFCLATIDPNGNPTNGIDWKTTTGAGYGNSTGYDALIAADAWDNKKYMNVYIVADLYDDGSSTNSGIAWYPNTSMSNSNLARVVYNGQYLGSNTTTEFASVLTHEFGHWLNLKHTFDGGCAGSDGVADTPHHSSTSLGCPTSQTSNTPISDCGNWVINSENYMDYNGCYSCYKNFTAGQVARMTATLNSNVGYRSTLCSATNLTATGCSSSAGVNDLFQPRGIQVFPNPSVTGSVSVELISFAKDVKVVVYNTLGAIVKTDALEFVQKFELNLGQVEKGLYIVRVVADGKTSSCRIAVIE